MHKTSHINVLISPLDWGLGHATRCVPIINECIRRGWRVTLAAGGRSEAFLKKHFPQLPLIPINAYNIAYPRKGIFMPLYMLLQLPRIVRAIRAENKQLEKIVREHNINLVISDNRYGLWNKKVYTVFITHQLVLKMPKGMQWMSYIIHRMLMGYINKFNTCWVPDSGGNTNLSGELSHKYTPEHVVFIGPLSRFKYPETHQKTEKKFAVLALISGPEPQRTLFEEKIMAQLHALGEKSVILKGTPEAGSQPVVDGAITVWPHADDTTMKELIQSAELVVCRAGYSSIMDLFALKASALLIPTPGQTEQQYLATYLSAQGLFITASQNTLSLGDALASVRSGISNPVFNSYAPEVPLSHHFDNLDNAVMKMFNFAND